MFYALSLTCSFVKRLHIITNERKRYKQRTGPSFVVGIHVFVFSLYFPHILIHVWEVKNAKNISETKLIVNFLFIIVKTAIFL